MIRELLEKINAELKECLENSEIKTLMGDMSIEEQELVMRRAFAEVSYAVLSGEEDIQDADKIFSQLIQDVKRALVESRHKYVFRVKVKGLTKYLSREIAIPSIFSLGDLGLAIVLAFRGNCSHLFDFEIDNVRYVSNNDNDYSFAGNAFEMRLQEFNFVPKKKFNFCYDFGDNYEFSVEFVKKVEDDGNYPIEVLKGKGYGIWEDNHYYLDMYYADPNTLVEDGWGEKTPVSELLEFDPEDFDYLEVNEELNDTFIMVRCRYEGVEDLSFNS